MLLVPPSAAWDGLAPARPGPAMADEASSPTASRRHRYDKRDYMYQAAVDLASIRICGYETPVP